MSEHYCYSCRFYKPYYTKGSIKFDRLDCGICKKTKQTVEKHSCCEQFAFLYIGRINRKEAALAALTENLNTVAEIKQILEEDDEDMLEEFLERIRRQRKKGST